MNKRILLSIFALSFIYILASCGDHSHNDHDNGHDHDTEEATHDHDEADHDHEHDHDGDHDHDDDGIDESGKEFTSAYICPMHCEGSGSDEPGQCPVCEMDYQENPDAKATEDEATSAPV